MVREPVTTRSQRREERKRDTGKFGMGMALGWVGRQVASSPLFGDRP